MKWKLINFIMRGDLYTFYKIEPGIMEKKNIKIIASLIISLSFIFLFSCVENPQNVSRDPETASEVDNLTDGSGTGGDPSATPPDTVSVTTTGARGLDVLFTQEMDEVKAEMKANYVINGLTVKSVTRDNENSRLIHIETSTQQKIIYTLLMVNLTNSSNISIPGGGIYRQFQGSELVEATLSWRDAGDPGTVISSPQSNPPYNQDAIYIMVNGQNIVAYRYEIDGTGKSAEKDISEAISLTFLADGSHTIKIWGRHSNGDWQEDNYPTSHTWEQDSSAPTAQFITATLPADPTDSQSVMISVTGTDVDKYYYKFSFDAAWSGPFEKNQPIQNGAPLPEGVVTLSVRGMDKSGNIQPEGSATGFTWVINASIPFAVLDAVSLPPSLSNQTSAAIYVTGDNDVVSYKGRIFSGDNCDQLITDLNLDFDDPAYPETDISAPLTISGMSGTGSGAQYTVCVIGKDIFNKWQTLSSGSLTTSTWIVDTDAMPAVINWSDPAANPGVTGQTDYTFEISGDGVAAYGWAVVPDDGADCASVPQVTYTGRETAVDTPLSVNSLTGNPQTSYTLCIKAKDGIGNWQNTTTETSWTIDGVPPAANPAISTGGSSVSLALTFTWDNTDPDWGGYRIQIAKSNDFSIPENIVTDAFVGRSGGATTSYDYAVNPNDGASYYARIKTRDSYENWNTGWGAVSAEHYVVGHIRGQVLEQVDSTTKAALNGITVEVLDSGGVLMGEYTPVTTANDGGTDGIFTINNLRIGRNAYRLRFSGTGYYTAAKRNLTIQAGTTLSAGQNFVVAGSHVTNRTVSGKVIDGNDGWMLGYALVELLGYDGTTFDSMRSDYSGVCDNPAPVGLPPANMPKSRFDSGQNCGNFSFSNVPPGVYTIRITGNSWDGGNPVYFDLEQDNITVTDTDKYAGRLPIVESVNEPAIKIVLTWGSADPRDLDFHVTGIADPPLTGGYDTWNGDNCVFPNYWGDDPGYTRSDLFHVWAARPNVGGLSWQQQFSAKDSIYIVPDVATYDGDNYFPMSPAANVALVQDANTGFGPETINFLSGYKNGTYWFTVFNWSYWYYNVYGYNDTTRISQGWDQADNIAIRIYSSQGLEMEIPFPVDQTSFYQNEAGDVDLNTDPLLAGDGVTPTQKEFWRPFKMTVTGPGSGGRQIQVTPPSTAFKNLTDNSQANQRDNFRCDQIW